MRQKFLLVAFISCLLLFVTHLIALRFDLYYNSSLTDTTTHTLAGIAVASVFCYALSLTGRKLSMGRVVIFVLMVGILWEVLEVKSGMTSITDSRYLLDTAGDLFFDVFGGFLLSILTS